MVFLRVFWKKHEVKSIVHSEDCKHEIYREGADEEKLRACSPNEQAHQIVQSLFKQLEKILLGHWLRVIIPLHLIAAYASQKLDLFLCFNALGKDGYIKI